MYFLIKPKILSCAIISMLTIGCMPINPFDKNTHTELLESTKKPFDLEVCLSHAIYKNGYRIDHQGDSDDLVKLYYVYPRNKSPIDDNAIAELIITDIDGSDEWREGKKQSSIQLISRKNSDIEFLKSAIFSCDSGWG